MKATAGVFIEDGAHTGLIAKVEDSERKPGMKYVDLHVQLDGVKGADGNPVTVKKGVSAGISPGTELGRLIAAFTGKDIVVGQEYDPEQILTGKKAKFLTQNEEVEGKGSFARILKDSLKPA